MAYKEIDGGAVLVWLITKTVLPVLQFFRNLFSVERIVDGLIASHIRHGRLTVRMGGGGAATTYGPADGGSRPDLDAEITIHDSNFYWRVVTAQDIGFAEAYMAGEWTTPDLLAVMRLLCVNRMNQVSIAAAVFARVANYVGHLRRRNSVENSQQNIADHYDLSNDFFSLFLDRTMMYSSAVFASDDEDLADAQLRKLDMLIDKAHLHPGDHLLEIGTGWGSLAIRAAQRTGCKVTSVTLSVEQLEWAKRRVAEEGLTDLIDLRLCDYRLIPGEKCFDAVISIEMIEAVGYEYYPSYFATIDRLLKPDGVAVIQAITIPDQRFAGYKSSCDFIQKYIFPGGLCPSVSALTAAMTNHSGLVVDELKNYPYHYHVTLERWAAAFEDHAADILALPGGNFDEKFLHMWRYYFAYCSAGFRERSINLLHLTLTRENNAATFNPAVALASAKEFRAAPTAVAPVA